MSRLVIFGASGFVGQALQPLLTRDGIAYLAFSSKSLDLTDPHSSRKIADILQDGDSILMLSALTPEKGDASDLAFRNILMMHNLLKGAESHSLAHFIYVSSDAVYPLETDVLDEDTPLLGLNLYGQMHVMRERMIDTASSLFRKMTILRPCALYGEGDTHNAYGIMRFIRSAAERGEIILFGEGEEYRDHLQVNDFAAIILDAYRRGITGKYNVASGTSWRFVSIAALIKAGLGKPVTISLKPRTMPIFHRHVNMTKTWSAFPSCVPRRIDVGVKELMACPQEAEVV